MATPALTHTDLEPSSGSLRFAELYSGPLSATALDRDVSMINAGRVQVSAAAALRGAKGALMAIGLEAFTIFLVYCFYQMLRDAFLIH